MQGCISFISQEKDKEQSQNIRKTCYWKYMSFVVKTREHVGTQSMQGALVHEHADMQDTLACKRVSAQGM